MREDFPQNYLPCVLAEYDDVYDGVDVDAEAAAFLQPPPKVSRAKKAGRLFLEYAESYISHAYRPYFNLFKTDDPYPPKK